MERNNYYDLAQERSLKIEQIQAQSLEFVMTLIPHAFINQASSNKELAQLERKVHNLHAHP